MLQDLFSHTNTPAEGASVSMGQFGAQFRQEKYMYRMLQCYLHMQCGFLPKNAQLSRHEAIT
jgi:hypothetical protein